MTNNTLHCRIIVCYFPFSTVNLLCIKNNFHQITRVDSIHAVQFNTVKILSPAFKASELAHSIILFITGVDDKDERERDRERNHVTDFMLCVTRMLEKIRSHSLRGLHKEL